MHILFYSKISLRDMKYVVLIKEHKQAMVQHSEPGDRDASCIFVEHQRMKLNQQIPVQEILLLNLD